MAVEIERKFLVRGEAWRFLARGTLYRQGYLNSSEERIVRVRIIVDKAFLAIKGRVQNLTRTEYEYAIPLTDGLDMLENFAERPLIEKTRYKIFYKGLAWEIDEFHAENAGLVVAEVELASVEQPFECPDWVGREVTGDPCYFNSNLLAHPFCRW